MRRSNSGRESLAKLILLRTQLDDILLMTALDEALPRAVRNELSVMRDDLERIIERSIEPEFVT